MKNRLYAVCALAALTACSSGNTTIPNGSSQAAPSLTKTRVHPLSSGIATATDLFIDDNGTMKMVAASASGAASFSTIVMPSTFAAQFNGLGGDEFAVTHGNFAAVNIFYVNSTTGTLTWCATPELYLPGHSINGATCAVKATVTDTADLKTGNESPDSVDVVWDATLGMLATLNSDNGHIATFNVNTSSPSIARAAELTFANPIQMMKMAADPLSGDLWVLNGDIPKPYLITATPTSLAVYEQMSFGLYSGLSATAFDVNENEQMWTGSLGGELFLESSEGTSVAALPGNGYCGDLSLVAGLASDKSNVYALGRGGDLEVYSDNSSASTCQPVRTITGLTNPLAIALY